MSYRSGPFDSRRLHLRRSCKLRHCRYLQERFLLRISPYAIRLPKFGNFSKNGLSLIFPARPEGETPAAPNLSKSNGRKNEAGPAATKEGMPAPLLVTAIVCLQFCSVCHLNLDDGIYPFSRFGWISEWMR